MSSACSRRSRRSLTRCSNRDGALRVAVQAPDPGRLPARRRGGGVPNRHGGDDERRPALRHATPACCASTSAPADPRGSATASVYHRPTAGVGLQSMAERATELGALRGGRLEGAGPASSPTCHWSPHDPAVRVLLADDTGFPQGWRPAHLPAEATVVGGPARRRGGTPRRGTAAGHRRDGPNMAESTASRHPPPCHATSATGVSWLLTMFETTTRFSPRCGPARAGYLVKGSDIDMVVRAINAVGNGEAIFGPSVARRILTSSPALSRTTSSSSRSSAPRTGSARPHRSGSGQRRHRETAVPQPKTIRNYVSASSPSCRWQTAPRRSSERGSRAWPPTRRPALNQPGCAIGLFGTREFRGGSLPRPATDRDPPALWPRRPLSSSTACGADAAVTALPKPAVQTAALDPGRGAVRTYHRIVPRASSQTNDLPASGDSAFNAESPLRLVAYR